MTSVAADYEHMEIQQQYSDVNNRWDVEEWDNENSSARLFERSRIKALAGKLKIYKIDFCLLHELGVSSQNFVFLFLLFFTVHLSKHLHIVVEWHWYAELWICGTPITTYHQ